MKTIIISFIYFLIGIAFMFHIGPFEYLPSLLLKTLIIPPLIIIMIINLKSEKPHQYIFMVLGLLFSWAGDTILEMHHQIENSFITGLSCFLIAHIMYLYSFFKTSGISKISGFRILYLAPVVIFGAILIINIYDDLGNMQLPVIAYSAVILLMLSSAIFRLGKVNRPSFVMVLAGAVLFVLSDSTIAVNKFSFHFKGAGYIVMSTYIAAQYFIILGYIKQYREKYI